MCVASRHSRALETPRASLPLARESSVRIVETRALRVRERFHRSVSHRSGQRSPRGTSSSFPRLFLYITAYASTRFIDKPDAKTADLEKHHQDRPFARAAKTSLLRATSITPRDVDAHPHTNETKKLEFQPTFTTLGDDRRGENNLRTRVKSIKISHPMSRSSRILPAGVCVCVCVTVLNSKKITDGCAYHVETKPRVTKRIILNPTRRLPSLYTRRVRVCGSTHSRTDGWMDDLCINCFYRDILWWRPKSV